MPYKGEYASKTSHGDIINNPDVKQFLADCAYLAPPSPEETERQCAQFEEPPSLVDAQLPDHVISIDGSLYEANVTDQLPSTKVGYIKIGSVLIDMGQYRGLRVEDGHFVDPFRVAKLQENNSPISFSLPSSNVKYRGIQSVRDGFRAALDEQLYDRKTRFRPDDPSTSLRTTLFHLAARRPLDRLGTNDPTRLRLHKCPSCDEGPIDVFDVPNRQTCPNCDAPIYPSDCLRVWEAVSNHQSNGEALSRVMSYVEHLLPIHYIRYLAEHSLSLLASTAFFVDGPLAVFGTAAWLSGSIMRFLANVNGRLEAQELPGVIMIGLQKTGQVADYVALVDRYIAPNRIFAITDDYRFRYIRAGGDKLGFGFGDETYYGQDFIYKTPSGRVFICALPYPFDSKRIPTEGDFIQAKTEIARYKQLPRALSLINEFECDLYENAVVPIALAHRYTAISLAPGGQVLDLLSKHAIHSKTHP